MCSLFAVAPDQHARGHEFDSAEAPCDIRGAVLREHAPRLAVVACEAARSERRSTMQVAPALRATGRMAAAEKARVDSLVPAGHGLDALVQIRRKLPRTAPLHTDRWQQDALHAHAVDRSETEGGLANFIWR